MKPNSWNSEDQKDLLGCKRDRVRVQKLDLEKQAKATLIPISFV